MSASKYNKAFSTVLYTMFVIERGRGLDVKMIAAEIGVAPSTLYEYIRDETTFPPDLIAPLFKATGDRRILSVIMNPANQIFFDAPILDGDPSREIVKECLASQKEHLALMQSAIEAVKDGEVTLTELEAMEQQMFEAHAAQARLFETLRRYNKRGKK